MDTLSGTSSGRGCRGDATVLAPLAHISLGRAVVLVTVLRPSLRLRIAHGTCGQKQQRHIAMRQQNENDAPAWESEPCWPCPARPRTEGRQAPGHTVPGGCRSWSRCRTSAATGGAWRAT